MDWPTAVMWGTSVAGAFLPLLAIRWGVLGALALFSAVIILLGGYLCDDSGYHPGMEGLICYLVPFVALVIGLSSVVVGACRCVGRARDWVWGRFPGILVPAVIAYGVPILAWAVLVT